MTRTIAVLLFCLIGVIAFGQDASDISFKLIKELTQPQKLATQYTIINQYNDGRPDQKMSVQVLKNKGNYFQKSDREEILLADGLFVKNNITRKTILISPLEKEKAKASVGMLDTALLRYLKNAAILSSNPSAYQMRISFPSGMIFQSLFVEADLKSKKLKKIVYDFNPIEIPFQKTCTIIFSEFNVHPKFSKQTFSTKQYFISDGKNIIPTEKFKGFQILDQRASI